MIVISIGLFLYVFFKNRYFKKKYGEKIVNDLMTVIFNFSKEKINDLNGFEKFKIIFVFFFSLLFIIISIFWEHNRAFSLGERYLLEEIRAFIIIFLFAFVIEIFEISKYSLFSKFLKKSGDIDKFSLAKKFNDFSRSAGLLRFLYLVFLISFFFYINKVFFKLKVLNINGAIFYILMEWLVILFLMVLNFKRYKSLCELMEKLLEKGKLKKV